MNLAALSFLFALLFAQQAGKAEVVSTGREFELKVGQEARVEGERLTISFVSVLEDSRCPEGVDCIWSGNAKIRLRLHQEGREPATLELNTHLEPGKSSYLKYDIRLVALHPRPKPDETTRPEHYKVVLVVAKK